MLHRSQDLISSSSFGKRWWFRVGVPPNTQYVAVLGQPEPAKNRDQLFRGWNVWSNSDGYYAHLGVNGRAWWCRWCWRAPNGAHQIFQDPMWDRIKLWTSKSTIRENSLIIDGCILIESVWDSSLASSTPDRQTVRQSVSLGVSEGNRDLHYLSGH